MPPKKPIANKGPPTVLAKMKARIEAQRQFEEDQKLKEEEEERLIKEEERLAEEERKFEEKEKDKKKDQKKEQNKLSTQDRKRRDKFMKLIQMKRGGMIFQETPEFIEFEKELEQEEKNRPGVKIQLKVKTNTPGNSDYLQDSNNNLNKEGLPSSSDYYSKIENLRSPICCVLGHVDTGKTSLLDKIRKTNVQEGEAGGITQQIGATFFPRESLVHAIREINQEFDIKVPGLLVIDTPGHESFANLRSRGNSICDISILVIDIMHGLEPQTRESIQLLKQRKCPFIVALNKVDRLYGWEPHLNMEIQKSLELQKPNVKDEYEAKLEHIKLQLAEEGFNSEVYYRNKEIKKYVSIIPTSARTGEGVVDLILLKLQLVQRFMEDKVTYKDELQCVVLEVKPVQGLGTTIDVILVNGTLHNGDQIVLCGMNGPIVTRIKALLTPQPLKELRVKGEYIHHNSIRAAHSVKILAHDLEHVIPGTSMLVVHNDEDLEKCKSDVMTDVSSVLSNISKDHMGVSVQSSTLGSLEALVTFLNQMKIPVAHVALGPIHKKHLAHVQAMKIRQPKYSCILAFDVEVTPEADTLAQKENIKIFNANIIYHLFDAFKNHIENYDQKIKERNQYIAVFPVSLNILDCFNSKDPLVLGCRILDGKLRVGTKLYVQQQGKDSIIGKITSLQLNNKDIKSAKKGDEVAVKIEKTTIKAYDEKDKKMVDKVISPMYGRQFDKTAILRSVLSRDSINALKESFRDEMDKDDWKLILELKKEQCIF